MINQPLPNMQSHDNIARASSWGSKATVFRQAKQVVVSPVCYSNHRRVGVLDEKPEVAGELALEM